MNVNCGEEVQIQFFSINSNFVAKLLEISIYQKHNYNNYA